MTTPTTATEKTVKVHPRLLYYFKNKQNNFLYTPARLFNGGAFQIEMSYNDNSITAMALITVKDNIAMAPNYYTFNKMYICIYK